MLWLAACAWSGPAALPDPAAMTTWAEDVLLGAEVGARRDVVVRWVEPVRFVCVAAPEPVRRAVEAAFEELRWALDGLHELSLEHVGEHDARIGADGYATVFALAPAQASVLAERYEAEPPDPTADGWFTIRWNGAHELIRATVFVEPGLPPAWLRHTVLEEMFHCLGVSNDSAREPDSVVYEDRGRYGRHQRLGRIDREVLRMLYGRLRPGDGADAIRLAIAADGATATRVDG